MRIHLFCFRQQARVIKFLMQLDMMTRSLTAAWDSSQNIELALDSRVLLFVLSVKADFAN